MKNKLDIEGIGLDDLLDNMLGNVEEDMKCFDDYINLSMAMDRELYLGDIVEGVGSTVCTYIRFWNKVDDKKGLPPEDRKPIKIYIDSNGGFLSDTLTMVDAIKLSKTPVWTICTGAAYSGGCFTMMVGHRRIGYKHSSYLFHEGSTQSGGTSSQFENFSKFYKAQLEQLKEVTLSNTSLDEDWYKEHRKEDIWFSAEEALKAGIIDEIAEELF